MSAPELFTYEGVEVRATIGEDGEPRFVAADVAALLGYAGGARSAIARLPERMKGVAILNTLGGQQKMTVLTEPGVNKLIMRAKTDDAERIQDWLAEDVIPQIRRTGGYAPPAQREPERFVLPQTLSQALRAYATEVEAREAADQRAIEAEAKVEELTPAANSWNAIASGKGTCSVGELSKMLANVGIMIGPNNLFKKLAEMKMIYRKGHGDNAYWEAYSEHVQAGRLTMKYQSRPEYEEGEVVGRKEANDQVRFTPKGLEYIIGRLANEMLVQPMLELVAGGAA